MSLLIGPHYDGGAPAPGGVSFADVAVNGYLAAYFWIGNDGLLYETTRNNTQAKDLIGSWIDPQVGMNLYECRATALDLDPPGGAYGMWLDLGQTQSWGWTLKYGTGSGTLGGSNDGPRFVLPSPFGVEGDTYYEPVAGRQGSFLLEIRRKSDGVVVDSGTVSVSAGGDF